MSPIWRTKILTGYGWWEIFKVLQPFWTSGRRRSYCFVQGKGHFPTVHTQGTQKFWHLNLQTMWWGWIHYDTTVYLDRDRQRALQHLIETQVAVSELRKYKAVATNSIWTVTSPPQTYSMIRPRIKFTVVVLPDNNACRLAGTALNKGWSVSLRDGDATKFSRVKIFSDVWRKYCARACVVRWCFLHYHAKSKLYKFWSWNFLCKLDVRNRNVSKIIWKL